MGRALSKTIRRALHILIKIQQVHSIRIVAQNVRTEDNIVEDCVSRGHQAREEDHLKKIGSARWGTEGGFMEEWENLLVEQDDKRHVLNRSHLYI